MLLQEVTYATITLELKGFAVLSPDLVVLHEANMAKAAAIKSGESTANPLSILPLPETVSDSLSVISSLNKEETIEITEKIDKKKLLLVEDNEELLKVMADSLSREYHIIKATNGKEAIEQLDLGGCL